MKILISEKLSAHKFKTPEGYLICTDAILARTGPQTYKRKDIFGETTHDAELDVVVNRSPEQVFSKETLASFENKPVCVEHPDENVNVENYRQYAVGFVRDIRRGKVDSQDVMLGTLVITDAQTIAEIENGEHTYLSCGYDCDIIDSEHLEQTNIRGNHVALCDYPRAGITRIVDSRFSDAKLPVKYRNRLSNILRKLSTFTKSDRNITDIIKEIEASMRREGMPVTFTREKIDGWKKTSSGMMRKDYFFSIDGYDSMIMISIYANEDTYKTTEINAYFVDSANILSNKEKEMKDEHLTDMDIDELMKYYTGKNTKWGANIFKINGKYTINPNISSRRYDTIAELEAGEEKYQAQIVKDYAPNDPNQFGDTIDDTSRDAISYYGNSWDKLVKKIVPKDKIVSIGTILGRGRSAIVEGKEYAEALKKATLSEGKTRVNVKPYGSYDNLFEVSFTDSAQAQDAFRIKYVKDNITHIVEVKAKTITDAVRKAKALSRQEDI